MSHITPAELALWQAQGFAFTLLDVRRDAARQQQAASIADARWLDPAAWLDWKDGIAATSAAQPVVLYCAKGHEIGQGLCAALRAMGVDARYLVGGLEGWRNDGRPTVPPPAL